MCVDNKQGVKNGVCNRTICMSDKNVVFFNHSTRKYYCLECALLLNEANKHDAYRLYRHALCMTDEHELPKEYIKNIKYKKEL